MVTENQSINCVPGYGGLSLINDNRLELEVNAENIRFEAAFRWVGENFFFRECDTV